MRNLIKSTAVTTLLCTLYLLTLPAADARTTLRESMVINDRRVSLVATGTRKELWVDIYRCGIYAGDGDTLVTYDTQKPVAVTFLVQTDLLPETPPAMWQKSLAESITPKQYGVLADSFAALESGERLSFVHNPKTGTAVTLSGKKIFAVAHHDLIKTVLKMLVGREPVSTNLRDQLLRHSS